MNSSADSLAASGAPNEAASRVLIAQVLEVDPDAILNANIALLRVISRDFSRVMSEDELYSLFACASHRARIVCPGWYTTMGPLDGERDFGTLRRCLAEFDVAQVAAMTNRFWDAFVDALASLIGEHSTSLQFRRALQPILSADGKSTKGA